MVIQQGDLFWADFGEPRGSEPGCRRPCIVVQNNAVNSSSLGTVIVCKLTSNLKRASADGNVLFDDNEGGLPRRSVANVSQVFTLDRSMLGERIGSVSMGRIRQIVDGIELMLEPREPRKTGIE